VATSTDYDAIDKALTEAQYYEMIDLINFEPIDKERRRIWIQKLSVSSTINLFIYRYGNYLGNVNIVWKIPPDAKNRDPAKAARNVNLVKGDISQFATRQMRRDFIEKYSSKCRIQPVILRNMFCFLTNMENSSTKTEAEIDERFLRFLMNADDPEIFFDLRRNNGRPNDPKYEPFWESLEKLLQEKSAVHERRQNDMQYLPFAMSVEDLRQQVIEKLPPGTPAPSVSWIRLNFQPKNPYKKMQQTILENSILSIAFSKDY
jgi:hypothetical protein